MSGGDEAARKIVGMGESSKPSDFEQYIDKFDTFLAEYDIYLDIYYINTSKYYIYDI